MYQVRLHKQAVKDLAHLPTGYARLIAQHIDGMIWQPRPPDAKKLEGDGGHSLRVGVYRILYDIDDETRTITIYRIKHRKEAYR